MQSRSVLARRIARHIALGTFRGHWDRKTLLDDAESVAWELETTAPAHVTPASIAFIAVKRVAVGRQHKQSVRSILTGRYDKRSKRPKNLRQVQIDLHDLAAADFPPSEIVPTWMDFKEWLAKYDGHKRAIAQTLAIGGKTSEVAAEFGLSQGRVSQLRREFERDWTALQSCN